MKPGNGQVFEKDIAFAAASNAQRFFTYFVDTPRLLAFFNLYHSNPLGASGAAEHGPDTLRAFKGTAPKTWLCLPLSLSWLLPGHIPTGRGSRRRLLDARCPGAWLGLLDGLTPLIGYRCWW